MSKGPISLRFNGVKANVFPVTELLCILSLTILMGNPALDDSGSGGLTVEEITHTGEHQQDSV